MSIADAEIGAVILRVQRFRDELHTRTIRHPKGEVTHTLKVRTQHESRGTLAAWASPDWQDSPALAQRDGMDAFHDLGPHGLLVLLETDGLYRVAIVRLQALPGTLPENVTPEPGPQVEFSGIELLAAAIRLYAVLSPDGSFREPQVALTRENTAETPYWWRKEDTRRLSAALLARAVSSAWRTGQTPENLDALVPVLRSVFRRYLLAFVHQRMTATRAMVASERAQWTNPQDAALRLDLLKGVLSKADDQFFTLRNRLRQMKGEDLVDLGPYPDANSISWARQIDKAYEAPLIGLDVAQARFVMHFSRDARGAAGLVHRSDVYDIVTERPPEEIRARALDRLDTLLASIDENLARAEREYEASETALHPFYGDLLGTQPVVDVALQLGFGFDVLFKDVLGEDHGFEPWAGIPDDVRASFRAAVPGPLIGEVKALQPAEFAVLAAQLAVLVGSAVAGVLTGQVWIPLVASIVALGIDGVDLYLQYDEIGQRGLLVDAIHGLPGYRDPELVDRFTATAMFATLSVLVDAGDAYRIYRRLSGVVSIDHRFSIIPGLRRAGQRHQQRVRHAFDPEIAAQNAARVRDTYAAVRFNDVNSADVWVLAHRIGLSNPATYAATVAEFVADVQRRGGWDVIESSLRRLGATEALDDLIAVRRTIVGRAVGGRVVDQAEPGLGRVLSVTSAGALDAGIQSVRQIRQALRQDLGLGWEDALGLDVHLALSPADRGGAVERLLDAWPAGWTDAAVPSAPAGQLAEFAELMSEGFGGWKALGRQLDDTDDSVRNLLALRDERLKPHILQEFGLGENGSTSISSDLDVSALYEVGPKDFRQRYQGIRTFMADAAGVDVDNPIWRNAFDMTVFCDPTLATFYNRLPDNKYAYVLAQHVLERSADLIEIIARPGEPLRGFDLLAEYAREHPFPQDILLARLGPGDVARTAQETEAQLLTQLDGAMNAYEASLASASRQEILDRGRRISDVALAVALTNNEAYFLAGATQTAVAGADAAKLFRNMDVALDRIRRIHLEDLRDTMAENWLVHVRPHVENAMIADPAGFEALDLVTQQDLLGRAFFALGKYGQIRAVGVPASHGAKLGFPDALRALSEDTVALGEALKALRGTTDPVAILEAMGRLEPHEIQALRLLRESGAGTVAADLGDSYRAMVDSGSLSPAVAAMRTHEALRQEVARLVGPDLDIAAAPSTLSADQSLLGAIHRTVDEQTATPLKKMPEFLLERLSPRMARRVFQPGEDPENLPETRPLGVTPPDWWDSVLDDADLAHLGLDPQWRDPG